MRRELLLSSGKLDHLTMGVICLCTRMQSGSGHPLVGVWPDLLSCCFPAPSGVRASMEIVPEGRSQSRFKRWHLFSWQPGDRALNQLYNLKIGLFALGGYFVLTKAVRHTMLLAFPSWHCFGFSLRLEVFHSGDSWRILLPWHGGPEGTHRTLGLGEGNFSEEGNAKLGLEYSPAEEPGGPCWSHLCVALCGSALRHVTGRSNGQSCQDQNTEGCFFVLQLGRG